MCRSRYGTRQCHTRVAKDSQDSSPELSDELHFMTLELRAGKSRRDALKNLSLRTNLDEVKSLVTLLIETEKFGTSMAEALGCIRILTGSNANRGPRRWRQNCR